MVKQQCLVFIYIAQLLFFFIFKCLHIHFYYSLHFVCVCFLSRLCINAFTLAPLFWTEWILVHFINEMMSGF